MIEESIVSKIVSNWIIDSPKYDKICVERLNLEKLLEKIAFEILTPEEKQWYDQYTDCCQLQGGSITSRTLVSDLKIVSCNQKEYEFSDYQYNIETSTYIYIYNNYIFTNKNKTCPEDLCRIPVSSPYPKIFPITEKYPIDLRKFDVFKDRYTKLLDEISDLYRDAINLFKTLYNKENNLTVNDLKLFYTKLYNYI